MSVAAILEKLAENAGRRQIAKGQLIGEAIAGASAIPAQIIEDRRKQALVDAEQRRADEGLQLRRNEDARQAAGESRTAEGYLQNKEKEATLRTIIAEGFKADPNVFDDKAAIAAAQQSKYPELVGTVQEIHAKLTKPVTPPIIAPRGSTLFDPLQKNPDGTYKQVGQGAPAAPTGAELESEILKIGAKPEADRTPDETARYQSYMNLKAPPSQSTNLRVRGIGDVPVSVIPSRDGKGSRYMYNGQDVTDRVSVIPPVAVQINNDVRKFSDKFTPLVTQPDVKDPTSRAMDPDTGLTPQGLWQEGGNFAVRSYIAPAGLGNSERANNYRAAVKAQGAEMAAQAGTSLYALQAEYRAKANELSNITPIFDRIATAANTGKSFLELATTANATNPRTQSKFVNKYVQLAAKNFSETEGLSAFELYIYSAAREYARVTTGAGASNAELTKAAAEKADALLNAAQAPKTFAAVAGAMQNDMDAVIRNQQQTLANVSSTIANFLSVTHGLPPVGAAPAVTPPPAATLAPVPAGRVRIVNIADPTQSGTILATDAVPAGWRKQ